MDDLVGRTMAKCRREDTLLMVISDHGFNGFRRGVDLNRWLEENGYLTLHDGRRGEEHLAGVDWSRTRAFAIGLTGIFINLKDKYAQGIVDAGRRGRPAARGDRRAARRRWSIRRPGRAPSSGSTSRRRSTAGRTRTTRRT